MISSSARSGGIASEIVPSSKYARATRSWVVTIVATDSAKIPTSCSSGRSISGVNTMCGCRKMRPKYLVANFSVIR